VGNDTADRTVMRAWVWVVGRNLPATWGSSNRSRRRGLSSDASVRGAGVSPPRRRARRLAARPARAVAPGADRDADRAGRAGGRLPQPDRAAGHHHERRQADLPCLRRARRVRARPDPRADAGGAGGGAGAGPPGGAAEEAGHADEGGAGPGALRRPAPLGRGDLCDARHLARHALSRHRGHAGGRGRDRVSAISERRQDP